MKSVFDLATSPLDPGVTLIEASAGTGKTFSLAGVILRLVLEEDIPISQILAVTYTIAATAELKERVRKRLHEALEQLRSGQSEDEVLKRILTGQDVERSIRALDLALQSFDEAQVFTIHSFCRRVLHDYAFESGIAFDAELVTDSTPLFEQVARDFWRIKFHDSAPLIGAVMIAWKQTSQDWVALLDQTRNHPDLVLIPPAGTKSFTELSRQIEQSLDQLRGEWTGNSSAIQRILRHDGNLSRSQTAFHSERVEVLLKQLAEACGDFDSADPTCFTVLAAVTTEMMAEGTKRTGTPPAHQFFDLCSDFATAVEGLLLRLTYDFLQFAGEEIPKRKARTNIVTFDDLVLRLRSALRSPAGERLAQAIGSKYQAALVDEFQDTDPAQYEIFQRIFGTGKYRLYYIGDPKQAIYGFRGADVFTYLQAAADANRTLTLGTNWRSEGGMAEAVNRLFQQTDDPFVLKTIEYHEIQAAKKPEFPLLTKLPKEMAAPLQFRQLASTRDKGAPMNQSEAIAVVGEAVATDMLRLQASGARLGDRPISFADMAILVRKHKQAAEVQEVLRAHGIRSIVHSERSVFESPEAAEFQQLLQGIIEPGRERLFKAALVTTLIGLNGDDLIALETDEAARQRWLDRFANWRDCWMSECFIATFRQILVEQDVRARLVQRPGGERLLTNFLHLAELLHAAETDQRLRPEGLSSWLRRQRRSVRVAQDEFQLRLESDSNAVQIVTIHKCKGLEYPIVFCPFLWTPAESSWHDELQFHDRDNGNQLTISLRGKAGATANQKAWQSEEVTSEEVRMLYIAITRAKNRCTIYVPDYKEIAKSPLARVFKDDKRGDLTAAITELAQQAPKSISMSVVEEGGDRLSAPPPTAQTFSARPFNRAIDRTAMVASFSGLISGRIELEERGTEVSDQPETVVQEEVTSGDTIFDFARGTRAGDFFHAVLERVDFTQPKWEPLVDEELGWHGLSKTKCRDAIVATMQELIETELEGGVSLNRVGGAARISELEFSYRLNRLDPERLRDVFKRCRGLLPQFNQNLGRLRFDPVEGFLRGFIDLFFEFGGRHYIVDWKSNWLGNRLSDYDEKGMNRAMLEHNYFLQAHLYVLAADLFLQKRLKKYDYTRDFGGVFYVFLRGINRQNPKLGIFRQQPLFETITALRELTA